MSDEACRAWSVSTRRRLGRNDLFRIGVPSHLGGVGGNLHDLVYAVAATAAECSASGLMLAGQRLLIEVLLQAENIGLSEYQLPDLLDGHVSGNCAATWPGSTKVQPVTARDTGRGWRMSGRLCALPNIDRNWFLVSVPVAFGSDRPYSLVLLKSEEDGIIRHGGASTTDACNEGIALELREVFLREDEILFSDAAPAVDRLAVLTEGLKAALAAGALRRAMAEGASKALRATVEGQLADAAAAVAHTRLDRTPRSELERLLAQIRGTGHRRCTSRVEASVA
jgi:alkylation response protein AidB-like acyl-CoA dehydrogenase